MGLFAKNWKVGNIRIYLWPFVAVGLFVLLMWLGACSTVKPYAQISVAYQLDEMTDPWLRTDRPDQCSLQPQAHAEVGVEAPGGWTIGYHHQSWWRCGGPFNDRPEMYQDDIRVTKKFGGL